MSKKKETTKFLKFDGRDSGKPKPMYDLLDPWAIEELVDVLTMGAQKYSPNNWHKSKGRMRYYAAALRHLFAWVRGEDKDEESGFSHLSHAMCCLMFIHGIERLHPNDDDRKSRDN